MKFERLEARAYRAALLLALVVAEARASGAKPGEAGAPALHPRMSCYACTTVDYESNTDNICRSLRPHNRAPPSSATGGHLHFAHQTPVAQTTTTTTSTTSTTTSTTTSATQTSAGSPDEGRFGQSPAPLQADFANTPAAPFHSAPRFGPAGDSNFVSGAPSAANASEAPPPSTAAPARQRATGLANNRSLLPSNFIRTRPCLEDENFCSIVSVVRIEFVQDNIYSKFWALERNCSKSCNTGCMVIGERVRLRVCSQCCRTPNCNVGSGAASGRPLSAIANTNQLACLALGLALALAFALGRPSAVLFAPAGRHLAAAADAK